MIKLSKFLGSVHPWLSFAQKLTDSVETSAFALHELTKAKKYDWLGAIGIVLFIRENRQKWFCSEWCAQAIGFSESWRFSPNDLSAIMNSDK